MNDNITIAPDNVLLAKKMAKRFHIEIMQHIRQNTINIALPGGSTPLMFFRELARHFNDVIPWDKIHIFWGDERCVPNNHKDSNYNLVKKNLLWFIDVPSENIHRVIGENKPPLEVRRYTSELKKFVPIVNGFPRFDIIILGIGDDGHTASIFPNNLNLIKSPDWCSLVRHYNNGQLRITLTGSVINNAKSVFFLASGEKKQAVLQSILAKDNKGMNLPAAHIKPKNGTLEFFLDEKAAGILN